MMYQSQFIEMVGNPRTNPKGWPMKRLPDAASYSIGLTYKPENVCEDGTIVLRSGNIQEGEIDLYDLVRVNTPIRDNLWVKEGDILMCSRNGSASLVGKVAQIKSIKEPMTYGAFMTIIRSDYSDYLYLYFQSGDFRDQISGGKSSTMNQITQKMLDKIEIPLPNQQIINSLSAILKQADKSKFGNGFKSQFIEMFDSMETTPVGEYIQDSYPGEWGVDDTDGTGIKVIRTTNFTNSGKLDLSNVVTRDIEEKKVNRKRIQKYDTILERSGGTTDNPVGRVVLFEEDDNYLCNNFTQVLRFKDVDPRFAFYSLYYFYQTNKTAIRGMGNKTTGIQNLNMGKYLEIGIPNASSAQQKSFVAIAEQADKSKSVCRQAIKRLVS